MLLFGFSRNRSKIKHDEITSDRAASHRIASPIGITVKQVVVCLAQDKP